MNFFGAIGGGQLTREAIRESAKATSPAILAEEALQEAVRTAGDLPAEEAMQNLEAAIGGAYEANVSVKSPQMKMAAALLATLENAARVREDAPPADPFGDQMNSLFADSYAMPEMDDE